MADASGTGDGGHGALAVGRALRDCREAYGRSLDDVAEATRIRRAYLDALEQGRYDEFPGEFWARLFLKSYAQHLGLPPDELLAEAFGDGPAPPPPRPAAWDRITPDDLAPSAPSGVARSEYRRRSRGRGGDDRAHAPLRRSEPSAPRGSRSNRRQWTSPLWGALAAIVVAALLAGIIYNFVHQGAPAAVSATARPRSGTGKAGSATTGGAKVTKTGTTTGHQGKAGPPRTTPTAAPTKGTGYTTVAFSQAHAKVTYRAVRSPVALHLAFQGRCWVGVTEGSSSALVVNHVYAAGQTLDMTATAPLHLTFGASWLASGTLDGQAIGPWNGGRVWDVTIEP